MALAVAASEVPVRLAQDAASGLAHIVQQYLEQGLAESARKRRRAARLCGRVALTNTDYGAAVTLELRGDEIVVHDGARDPLDASIEGPHATLLRVLRGQAHPLLEHLRGRLRVRSRPRRLLLPLRLHRIMKLSQETSHVGL